jgi:hypothetical protein
MRSDFSSLKDFAKRLNVAANGQQKQQFYEDCCKELTARFLAKVIKRTPVGKGQFEVERDGTGNPVKHQRGVKKGQVKLKRLTNGGTLRRGWTAKTENEALSGNTPNTMSFVAGLKVQRSGKEYTITIINPVSYASYIEYGHRQTPGRFIPVLGKKTKAAWVKGQFMMTISEKELVVEAPRILDRKLDAYLRSVFYGK